MKLKPYPEYKESGVEWLGSIPSHWSAFPLRFMASESNSLFIDGDWVESKDLSDSGIRYLTTGNVGEGEYKEQGTGYISEEKFKELNCTEVLPGDILISRLNLPIARACLSPNLGERVISSVDIVVFRPNATFNRNFIIYMLSSKEHFANTENLARGTTMQRISRSSLGRIRFVLPKYDEQACIANYLDRETTKLDTLIAKQESLIELLQEKRQAIISHAVTKGLNPDANMKDSGVEWLGMVPEGWSIKPLKYITSVNDDVISESTDPEEDIEYVDIGSVSVENGIEKTETMKFSDAPSRARRKVRHGDVIVSTVRTYLKAIAPINNPSSNLVCSTGFAVVRPSVNLNPVYAKYSMQTGYFIDEVISRSVGVSYPAINSSDMICIRITAPSIDDQFNIANFLDRETTKIDTLIDKAKRSIELAKEHRTALISAAVTGKIDVREAA